MNVLWSTWAALLQPGRALAIGAVVLPLLYAQAHYNADPWDGVLAGLSLSAAAVLVAPVAWRVLAHGVLGGLSYAMVGVITVLMAAMVLPRWLSFEDRFLTLPETLPFVLGLWLVAGFGLGRDVAAQHALEEARQRAEALQKARDHAELLAIRAHLDPHFLFNTLNALAEWCRADPLVAEKALLQLANVLRTVLGAVKEPTWPLSRELALIEQVMALYRIRDPERFDFTLQGEPPALEVPALLLLPLVENAFKYGPGRGHAGRVEVTVEAIEGGALVVVRNPGPFEGERAGGHGLALVRQRLRLQVGHDRDFQIGTRDGATVATLRLS